MTASSPTAKRDAGAITRFLLPLLFSLAVGWAAPVEAQRRWGEVIDLSQYRNGVPTWEIDPHFAADAFTFVRLRPFYHRRWTTDYPDAELNFSWRLHEMTALLVNPNPIVLEPTDPALRNYPFCYIAEPGYMELTPEECEALRDYCLSGGFLMLDDFWGDYEGEHVLEQVRRIFPGREIVDLPIEHPLFQAVFRLKEKPQLPAINVAVQGRDQGITWEKEGREVHYRAVFDDQGRMMFLMCQNTDLGDGWEREGDNEWYFREFSEKKAYPMGINIIFYLMTR